MDPFSSALARFVRLQILLPWVVITPMPTATPGLFCSNAFSYGGYFWNTSTRDAL